MEINLKEYQEAIKIASQWLKRRHTEFDAYDIVHETICQYNSVKPSKLRAVYFMFISLYSRRNKDLSKFPMFKVCKSCSPQDPIPISAFYIFRCKNGRIIMPAICIPCHIKKSTAYHKLKKDDKKYKETRRKAWRAYYHRKSNTPQGKVKYMASSNKWRKDKKNRAKINAYRRALYLKKIGRPLKNKSKYNQKA